MYKCIDLYNNFDTMYYVVIISFLNTKKTLNIMALLQIIKKFIGSVYSGKAIIKRNYKLDDSTERARNILKHIGDVQNEAESKSTIN